MAVLALLVILLFPPRELPKLARSAARAYGSVRRIADDFHRTVMLDEELRSPIDEIRGAYDEARWDIRRAGERFKDEISSVKKGVDDAVLAAKDPGALESAPVPNPDDDEHAAVGYQEYQGPYSSQEQDIHLDGADDHALDRHREEQHDQEEEAYELPLGAFESSEMPPPEAFVPRANPAAFTPQVNPDAPTPPWGVNPAPRSVSKPAHPSLQGRVAATGASVPDAAPAPAPSPAPPTADAPVAPREATMTRAAQRPPPAPAVPQSPMPAHDSDQIDDSALTRVARLPMPPPLSDAKDDSGNASDQGKQPV